MGPALCRPYGRCLAIAILLALQPSAISAAEESAQPLPDLLAAPCVGETCAVPPDRGPRVWLGTEFLLWWVKGAPLSGPLLTLGDPVNLGVLGRPGTTVLVDNNVNFAGTPGARVTLGGWLGDGERFGVEANYFFLGRDARNLFFQSNAVGEPVMSVPYFQVGGATQSNPIFTPTQIGETATQVSAPGLFAGIASVDVMTRLMGAELNGVTRLWDRCGWRLDLLSGFRFLDLWEKLHFDTSSAGLNPPSVFLSHDEFNTINQFYGGQAGARVGYDVGPVTMTLSGKIALGTMQETVNIKGSLATNDLNNFGPVQNFPGGYFALPTNIGHHYKSEFAVVPEVGLGLGYWLTSWARVTAGYSFLYVSRVARPGDQIDRAINTLQAPGISGNPPAPLVGPARPAFFFNQDDFWAHGLSVGLELKY
jgi:Putative beta barrel porin-7 (BBP7)